MIPLTLNTGSTWAKILSGEIQKPYFQKLLSYLDKEYSARKKIYPPRDNIFDAFILTPFENLKGVIIGQDPYHGPNQAHGLCFSVREGVRLPPSLRNIFQELQNSTGLIAPKSGDLSSWARNGVLLLNSILTVEEGKPGSHESLGWEEFTDHVISQISEKKEHVAFILWGSFAQAKGHLIDEKKHFIIRAPHPSPLSSYRGFFGSKPFTKVNSYLKENGIEPIEWTLK